MIARARVVVELDDCGVTRLRSVHCEPPLALRTTPDALCLVASAAGPLGGDDLALSIDVGDGAQLTVHSAAASVALPGPSPSRFHVEATVGRGALLCWLPEPLIAARGCRHEMTVCVGVAENARIVWREELLLGRHDEPPGSATTRLTIDIEGRPLLRQELGAGPHHPAWASTAVAGGAKAIGSLCVVDPAWGSTPPPTTLLGPTAAVLPLAGPAVQVLALADNGLSLRRLLDDARRALAPVVPST